MNTIEKELLALFTDPACSITLQTIRRIRFPANYRFESHAHPQTEINYINSGCCMMEVEGQVIPLKRGSCIMVNPYQKHLFMVDVSKSCAITQLIYKASLPGEIPDSLSCFKGERACHVFQDCEELCGLMESIQRNYKKARDNGYAEARFDFILLQLFAMLSGCIEEESRLTDGCRGKLEEALEKIQSRLEYEMNLEELAGELGISSRYLRKLFVQRLGISCTEYITMLRIAKAKEYLRDWDKGVTEAAALSGFNSPQYFCRVFRKHTGMTPAAYKRLENEQTAR